MPYLRDSADSLSKPFDAAAIIRRIQTARSLNDALAARNELVERYLYLAHAAARNTVPPLLRSFHDDAVQEACCALMGAAARFDPDHTVPFHAYAYGAMRHRIQSYLRLHRHQAIGERLGYVSNRIWRYLGSIGAEIGDVSDAQIAAGTNLPMRSVRSARPWLTRAVELDSHGPDDCDECLAGVIPDDVPSVADGIAAADDHVRIRSLVAALHPKDRHLVTRVFGLDGAGSGTIRDAVVALGFSQQRGSVRLKRALSKLRDAWRE